MKQPGTPIAWPLRLWFVFEVLFGIGAVLTIALSPGKTASNFAWPVLPVVMAAVLGAFYVSSALLFVLPLFARRWEMIRVMVLPTALFSTTELAATLLHWDKFSVGTGPFYVWLLSYVLPPPIFVAGYVLQEWRARRGGTRLPADPLAPDVRRTLLHFGALLAGFAVVIFVFPRLLIPYAPWTMTPLTTRALAGWLLAAGTMMLSMARENHRAGVLVAVPLLLLMFPAITLQLARFPAEVSFANAALFAGYGITLVAFALGVHLVRGNWRQALG
jgi:hypothetical protein